MPHMIALREFPYAAGSLQLKPGDKFFALSERDAKWLKVWGKAKDVELTDDKTKEDCRAKWPLNAAGKAKDADEKCTQISDALHAAVMEPEEPAPVRAKRKYTRRDISYWSK